MKITLTINTSQGQRKIDAMVSSLQDLRPALKAFNKYFRRKVQDKFTAAGPGWPATKAATDERKPGGDELKKLADAIVKKKLLRQYRNALKRAVKGKGTAAAVARRYMVAREFDRLAAGGLESISITGDKRLDKSVSKLRERQQRATEQASKRPLGRLASSIKSEFSATSLRVYSQIDWAGVHNEGGVAGHGAKIPARTFLEVTPEDVDLLAEIIQEQALAAFEGGADTPYKI
jgi:phage gpG-like protein